MDRRASLTQFTQHFAADFANQLGPIAFDTLNDAIQHADEGGYRPKEDMFTDLLAVLPWTQPPTVEGLYDYYYTLYPQCALAMPDAYDSLDRLHALGLRTGIVTNGPPTQNDKIDILGLRRYMEVILVSDDVGIKKPDARIFALALEALALPAEEAVFVGDHPGNDILGARAAGLRPIWMRGHHPWPPEYPEPKLQVDSLHDLVALLEQLQA